MSQPEIVLDVKLRGDAGRPLLPEEAAAFDLVLRNDTQAPATVLSLELNVSTPVLHLTDEKGQLLGTYDPESLRARVSDAPIMLTPVETTALSPGQAHSTWVNLWQYTDALPQGRYALQVEHRLAAGGPIVTSQRVPFEIVNARVGASALGYESVGRFASVLAWVAIPVDGGDPRWLVRLSDPGRHRTVHQGAASFGVVSAEARVAVSQIPRDGDANWLGWAAAVSGDQAELVRHNMTFVQWRSGAFDLPVRNAVPVPRFPDRGRAVFLATGMDASGAPALSGAVVRESKKRPAPWSVPLARSPVLSACAFTASGPIALLFVTDDGEETTLSRLDIDESGQIEEPERVVRKTPHRVLAVTSDIRKRGRQWFAWVEADRTAHDRVAVLRLPVHKGAALEPPLEGLPGWPSLQDRGPLASTTATLDIGLDGAAWLAIVDERGRPYAGRTDIGLAPVRDGGASSFAHVATLTRPAAAAFTEEGLLHHPATGGH